MKRILILLFLILFLSAANAEAVDRYVTQSGAGSHDGTSVSNAYSASEFNALSGDKSNTNYYFSGTFSTRIDQDTIYGTLGSPVVLDGWEGGSCDPVASECTSSAVLSDGVRIHGGIDHITIQDFRMTETGQASVIGVNNSAASGESDYITIQRNYLYDADLNLLSFNRSSAYDGSDYVTVEDNKMVGYGRSYDAAQGVNFYYCEDVVVRNNIFAGTGSSSCSSDNVIEVHTTDNAIFEYNEIYSAYNQAGIAIKEPNVGNHGIIVRFNKIHSNGIGGNDDGRGMFIGWTNSYNIFVYGNKIYNNQKWGIDMSDGISDVYIWSNIIHDHPYYGIYTWNRDYDGDNINIINNTLTRNGTIATGTSNWAATAIHLGDGGMTNITVKNNLISNNRPNADNYQQFVVSSSGLLGDIDLDYGTYYFTEQTPNFYYDLDFRTLAVMQGTYSLETNGDINDPGFTDPDGADNTHGTDDDDYTLDGSNIDDGADLSASPGNVTIQGVLYTLYYDDAIDPANTDWTTTPPTVATVDQDDYGAGWERGAYVYGASWSITASDNSATENGDTGAYTITLTGGGGGESVDYAFSGTATDTVDYNDDNDGTITYAELVAGSKVVTITTINDEYCEDPEAAIATLSNAVNSGISTSQAEITIQDDAGDCGGAPSSSGVSMSHNSGGPSVSYQSGGITVEAQ